MFDGLRSQCQTSRFLANSLGADSRLTVSGMQGGCDICRRLCAVSVLKRVLGTTIYGQFCYFGLDYQGKPLYSLYV